MLDFSSNVGNILQEGGLNTTRPRKSSVASDGKKSHMSRSGKKTKGRKSLAFTEFGQFSDDSGSDEDTMVGNRKSDGTEMTSCGGDMLRDFDMAIKLAPSSQSQKVPEEEPPSMSQPTQSNRNFAPDSPELPVRTSFAPRMSEFAPPGNWNTKPLSQPSTIMEEEELAPAAPGLKTITETVTAPVPKPSPVASSSSRGPSAETESDPVKLLLGKLNTRDSPRFESLPESITSLPESSHPTGGASLTDRGSSLELTSGSSTTGGQFHFNISGNQLQQIEVPKAPEPGKISFSFRPVTEETPKETVVEEKPAPVNIFRPSPSPEGHVPGMTPKATPTLLQQTPLDRQVVAPTPATVLDPPFTAKPGPTLQPSTQQKEQEKLNAEKRKSMATGRKSAVRPSFGHGGVPVNKEAESGEIPDIIAELLGPDPMSFLDDTVEQPASIAPTEADPSPNRDKQLNIFTQESVLEANELNFFTQESIPEEPKVSKKDEDSGRNSDQAFFDCEEVEMDTDTDKKEFPPHIKSLFEDDSFTKDPVDPAPQPSPTNSLSLSQPAPTSLFSQLDTSAPSLTQPDARYSVASSMSMASSAPGPAGGASTTPTQQSAQGFQLDRKPVPSPFLDNRHMSITSEDLHAEDEANSKPKKLELQPSEKQKMAEQEIEVVCAGRQSIAQPLIPLQPNSTVPTPKRDANKDKKGPSDARSLSQLSSQPSMSQVSLPDTLMQTPMGIAARGTSLDEYDYARMPARQLTPIPEGENENTTISERSSAVSELPVTTLSAALASPAPPKQDETEKQKEKEKKEAMAQGTPKDMEKRVSSVGDGNSPTDNWLGRPSAGPSNFPSLAEYMTRKPENEVWNSPSEESPQKKTESRIVVETPGKKTVLRARTPRSSARKTSTTISFHITSPAPRRTGGQTGVSHNTFNLSVTSGETGNLLSTFDTASGPNAITNGGKRSESRLGGGRLDEEDDLSSEIAAGLGGASASKMGRTPREDTDMSMALGQTTMFGGLRPMQEDTDMSVLRKSMARGMAPFEREDSSMSIAGATLTQMGGLFQSSNIAVEAAAAAAARDQQQSTENKENFQEKADRRKTMDFFGRSKKEVAPDPGLLDDANLDTDDEGEGAGGFKDYETPQARKPMFEQQSAVPAPSASNFMPMATGHMDGFSSDSSSNDEAGPPPNQPIPIMAPISGEVGKEPAFMQQQKESTTPLMDKSDDSFTLITKARDANNTVTQMGPRGSPISVPPGSPRGNTVSGLEGLEDSIHDASAYLKPPDVSGMRRPGNSGLSPNAKRARHGGGNVAELVRNSPRKGPASFGSVTAQLQRPPPRRGSPQPQAQAKPPGEVPYVPSGIHEFGSRPNSPRGVAQFGAPSRQSFAQRIAEASYADPKMGRPNATPEFNTAAPAPRVYSPRAMPQVLSPWAAEGYEQPNYQNRPRPNVVSSPMPTRNVALDSATPRLQLTSTLFLSIMS